MMITDSIEVYRTLLKFILHLTKRFSGGFSDPPKNASGDTWCQIVQPNPPNPKY